MMTRIERQTPDHAEGLFEALSDLRIYDYLDDRPHDDVAATRARLERLQAGGSEDGSERWFNWTVFHDDTIVGHVQATVFRDRCASIAYVLTPALWGRGVAFEACRQMLAELLRDVAPVRFVADAERDNRRSHRLLGRLGFTRDRVDGNDVFYVATPDDIVAALTARRDSL